MNRKKIQLKLFSNTKQSLNARKRKEDKLKKKKDDEEQAAKVYEQFVASFEAPNSKRSKTTVFESKLSHNSISDQKPSKYRRNRKKKVRNIDLFMQEIKLNAMTRDMEKGEPCDKASENQTEIDPLSSNIIVHNIPKDKTEFEIAKEFRRFGTLAGVMVLPLSENKEGERSASINFMGRDDAKRALENLKEVEIFSRRITAQLGRRLPKPNFPLECENAAADDSLDAVQDNRIVVSADFNGAAENEQKAVIDTVAKAVAEGGSVLEQNIMEIHRTDPCFAFLFNFKTPLHAYYRWRLYAYTQGDSTHSWREDPFRFVSGGKIWVPPVSQPPPSKPHKTEGKHDEKGEGKDEAVQKGDSKTAEDDKNAEVRNRRKTTKIRLLTSAKREELNTLLDGLTRDRLVIRDAMGFCIDNSENAVEVSETIVAALMNEKATPEAKLVLLYLISDVLHNSSSHVRNSSAYRAEFQPQLRDIFREMCETLRLVAGRMTAGKLKNDVVTVLRVWHAWSLYPGVILDTLENAFLETPGDARAQSDAETVEGLNEIDGVPLEDEIDSIDGVPLDP